MDNIKIVHNPIKTQIRYLVLIFSSLTIVNKNKYLQFKKKKKCQNNSIQYQLFFNLNKQKFADYYIMDIPALIKSQIEEVFSPIYGKEETQIYYSFLYSVYSIPNIILPLFGGILCDQLGYRKMTLVFLFFITLGQIFITYGVIKKSIFIMIFGRFIFGIGGESLNISINSLIVNWFQGSELSFAQALNLSFIRSASVLNTFMTPRIAEYKSMDQCFIFGIFICFLSFFSSILLVYIDYNLNRNNFEEQKEKKKYNQDLSIWENIFLFSKKFQRTCKKFNLLFWALSILTVFLYVEVITFNTFSSSILIELWLPQDNTLEKNQELAGEMMSIPYLMASFLFPLFGFICDKYGQRINLLIVASLLCLTSFIIFPILYPVISLSILGLSYAMFGAVIWPTISYIIPQKRLGIGYGVMNSIQNFGTGIMPLVIAFIEINGNSMSVIFTFISISIISVYLSIVVQRIDSRQKISLNENDQ
ncbi:major facilitator superfamily protein, putative, partial [Ichthyophthirius multifiliis]